MTSTMEIAHPATSGTWGMSRLMAMAVPMTYPYISQGFKQLLVVVSG